MPHSKNKQSNRPGGLSRFQPPLYVIIFGILFGTTISMAKLASTYGISPISLVFWQMFGAGLLLALTAYLKGQPLRLKTRHLRYYFIAGLLGNALPTTLAFMAAVEIGTALTGLVYPLSPIVTYGLAILIGLDKRQNRKILGMLCGFVGAAIILLPPIFAAGLLGLDYLSPVWLSIAFSIPVLLGFGNIYRTADWPPDTGSLPLAAGMLLATSLLLFPILILIGDFQFPDLHFSAPTLVIGGNIVLSFIGFIFYFELQRISGPVYFSQISYFITITTMGFGYFFFKEPFEWYILSGAALIFGGLYLVSRSANE